MTDKLSYFDIRGRAEPVRMMYALAGKDLDDDRIKSTEWEGRKKEFPNQEVPILKTADGCMNQSTAIGRYVAKRFGFMGGCLWEEAVHDMVVENINDTINDIHDNIYKYKMLGEAKPDNFEELEQKTRCNMEKRLKCIQKIAECRGKKFIVCDEIGLGDIWTYCMLEFSKSAFPDIMSITEWTKCWSEKMESDPKIKKYLKERKPYEFAV